MTQARKLTRKLSNIGLSTLVTEVPSNLSIPVSVVTLEGSFTREDYLKLLQERLLQDPFFLRWRSIVHGNHQTGEYEYMEVPNYDITQNVVEHTVKDGETTLSYVESVLVNSPLDFKKPLWEMHVISDPNSSPRNTSIGWKVHHCLGDGASLALAMVKLSDQSDFSEKRSHAKNNLTNVKSRESMGKIIKSFLAYLYLCLWSIYVIFYHVFAMMTRPEPATVFKRPGGTRKRLSYKMKYSVKTTKAVGKHFQATVNDVMLTVLAGAMRRTMLAEGQSVEPSLKVRCAIPVDMRSRSKSIRHTSNQFSSLIIDLPLGIEDPAQRLRRVTSSMNGVKNSLAKYFMYYSIHLLSQLPAPLMRSIVHFFTSRISVAVTNVRASVIEMSLCNKQVSGFYGFVPPPPYVNLGVAILSTGDDLGLNVLVDPCVGVDAEQFLEFALEEYSALHEIVTAMDTYSGEEGKKVK
ncbi:acyltransferase ws dgat mgat family protein [Plasmopara halstedii]|uniref:Acyltransferase ws dgat mgat family protein n=1 Tax=Plasmopara halstedii TaxID=4781 RepID=A0A0P1ACF5_PLAHL|nr:acyltransferase ws dgat mgat family protein [Plasmopara halstedii]CEG37894.1 acyltransferase ws dgat mgat family protein [Plasmopara halstedii]|eukprot:XP_024574263.1 acyltransferase ws dgat mgat family protein [Plasmopara halstedii]